MNTRTFPVSNIANGGSIVVGPGEQFNWIESGSQSCNIAVQGSTMALSSANSFPVTSSGASSTAVATPGTTGSYTMTPGGIRPNSIPFSIIVGSGKYDVASSGEITGKQGMYFIWQNDSAAPATIECSTAPAPNWWPQSGYEMGGQSYLNIFVPGGATLGTFQIQITANGVTLSQPKIIVGGAIDPGPISEREEQQGHEKHEHHKHHEHKR